MAAPSRVVEPAQRANAAMESAAMAVCQLPVGRHQVSNESLILAQNQRWRRA